MSESIINCKGKPVLSPCLTRCRANERGYIDSRSFARQWNVAHAPFLMFLQVWAGCLPASVRNLVWFECGSDVAWISEELVCVN